MKITSIVLNFIKSFKALRFDLEQTSVLIGQNDHGKSSILKAIDIVLNQLDQESLRQGVLHPDLAERLLPIFQVNAKARRITINYKVGKSEKQLYITVRTDLTFIVHEKIERNAKTTESSLEVLKQLRESNRFLLIPALRDASSTHFQDLFSRMLRQHGLAKVIPQKAGGTPREYRILKEIRDRISDSIKPYIDNALLPEIEKHFGFGMEHALALKFDVDVQDIGEWVLDNLRLGFQVSEDKADVLALSEAGSGVQSGVLLALHRLEQQAAKEPNIQYILAVEEPEAFLHPQKQRELYQGILSAQSDNLKIIVTTHSPYIASDTPFSKLGLVRRSGQHSSLHVPAIKDNKEEEMFDAYSNEVNSLLLFAERVVLVEGESDVRVLRVLLEKTAGVKSHRTSVISASGNKNFSPFLRMIRAWSGAEIPHLVVTDFDSLTKDSGRAIVTGARDAGYVLNPDALFAQVDAALDRGEGEFEAAAKQATQVFAAAGLNVFVFTSDLEYALINAANKDAASKVLNECSNGAADYRTGYDLNALRRLIGSKGIPLNPANNAPLKKPFVHRKIAMTLDIAKGHPDWARLIAAVGTLK